MELDLHRLELRFAATRINDALAVQRLANSIEANGQLVECVAAGEPADVGLVLIDGYRRVAALRRLGRDTAQVQYRSCPVGEALAQVLARAGSRPFRLCRNKGGRPWKGGAVQESTLRPGCRSSRLAKWPSRRGSRAAPS